MNAAGGGNLRFSDRTELIDSFELDDEAACPAAVFLSSVAIDPDFKGVEKKSLVRPSAAWQTLWRIEKEFYIKKILLAITGSAIPVMLPD
ncbi:hypothetical protein [Chlorobium sp. N1]|uniref:hypothetical protein n=1 Tax=Chlorobium sp. N1 TaxID=2491138 RepID=UPI0013F17D4E|nr:hypothetical protein [Chlorobium sp. N1]